ncbi:MAG: ATP-binding protein [Acetobacteraceae bacterium]|nr:ATP-binding protein [Acetobacteraceae bacterium]
MGLLAIAAVPLVTMAGIAAWQTYEAGVGQGQQLVLLARESAIARHQAAVQTVRQMLGAAAQTEAVTDAARCPAYLNRLLELDREWYSGLRVVGSDGRLVCAAGPGGSAQEATASATDQALARDAEAAGDLVVSHDSASPEGVTAAFPIIRNGEARGAVLAGWRKDQFIGAVPAANEAMIWLVDANGQPLVSDPAAEDALPPPAVINALLSGSRRDTRAVSRGGQHYVYASGLLSDGWRVLVGLDETAGLTAARALLLARFIETAVLLLVGLVAVGIGVNAAVVEPIKLFTRAVSRWRGGGPFTPGNLTGVPSEVAELSTAFSQATGKLADREAQLRNALSHQDLLMLEIHHRVRNNLQIVASLLNLQGSRITQPAAQAEFQSARDRVRALATLHRHLYAHGELHTINMRSFLTELCTQLLEALGEAEGQRIRLDIEAPESRMTSDQAVPLALIVTETVTNAVKHAFPGGRQGVISVRLTAAEDKVVLLIEDDGVGLEAGRAESAGRGPGGIGVQLIRGFARQLGARLIVEEERGTRYVLEIPSRPDATARRRAAEAQAFTA